MSIFVICSQDNILVEDLELFEEVSDLAYKNLSLKGDCYVELLLSNDEEIKTINKENRGIEKATDVLSFPYINFDIYYINDTLVVNNFNAYPVFNKSNFPYEYDENLQAVSLGSIVISLDKAKAQALAYNHSFRREKAYLFLHGFLHILGFDHINEQDQKLMRKKEEDILSLVAKL